MPKRGYINNAAFRKTAAHTIRRVLLSIISVLRCHGLSYESIIANITSRRLIIVIVFGVRPASAGEGKKLSMCDERRGGARGMHCCR